MTFWWLEGYIGPPRPVRGSHAANVLADRRSGREPAQAGVQFVRAASADELWGLHERAIRRDLARGLSPFGLADNATEAEIRAKVAALVERQLDERRRESSACSGI